MTRQEAVKKLSRIYGKKAAWRVSDKATNASGREKAGEASAELGRMRRELSDRIEERKAQLLNVPDYQEMLKTKKELDKRISELTGMRFSYKFQAGYVSDLGFFHVEGQGDTWEEVFTEIEKKNPRGVTV